MNSRRSFLKQAGAGTALAMSALGPMRLGFAQPAATGPNNRVVVIFLRGALDGLSLLAPHADTEYYRQRPNLALAKPGEKDGLLPIDQLFGLHPSASALMPFWQKQQLAFVHASGSHDTTRSHFDAQDYMETGTPGRKTTPDGWLNRLASTLPVGKEDAAARRLHSVNVGPTLPRIFVGDVPVASLASGSGAVNRGPIDRQDVAAALGALYGGEGKLGMAVQEASITRKEIMQNLASDDPKADQGSISLGALAQDSQRLGQLMVRDPRVRLAFIPVGGWDTHVNQGAATGLLATRIQLMAQAVDSLSKSLGDVFKDTTIMILSEFGRTVAQNGSGGTDHGHGNVAMLLGGGVRGGKVYGQWPGLSTSALYEGRDLAITTDFRSVIADVAEQRFALNDNQLSQLLPGFTQRQRLGMVSA